MTVSYQVVRPYLLELRRIFFRISVVASAGAPAGKAAQEVTDVYQWPKKEALI